jgi:hypothetical protein
MGHFRTLDYTLLCRPITCGTEHLARPRHVPARFFCSWHRDEALPDRRHAAIVCTVIGLARGVQLPVLAEGVKTNEQLALLSREARDEVQGYFVRRPLPIEHYTATQLAQAFESLLG